MDKNVIAVILGGGAGSRLSPLTSTRSKPAVPIAGKYRLVDIPISNCLNSNIGRMYVLTQFNSASLNKHIKNTYHFSAFSSAFVDIIAAEQTPDNPTWFQGTADAVRQSLRHIKQQDFSYVLILSGDQLYQMDFQEMIDFVSSHHAIDSLSVQEITNLVESGLGYRKLPFVWVFGRKFWTVSLYGANVFVENVMVGLEQPEISEFVTGKFVLSVSDHHDDCRLLIRIELATSNIPENFIHNCGFVIRDQISRLNSEYKNYVPEEKKIPSLVLHPMGDLPYFRAGVKHQYIQN